MKAFSPDSFVDTPWYLALCRPNQGHIAFRNLTKVGFDVFMPRYHTSWNWRGKRVDGLRPLFGGYLFFSMGAATPRWQQVANTPGIGSLVKTGSGGPVQVPSAVVTTLMSRCDADGCLIPEADYCTGEAVRLVSGPLAGFIGEVERVDPDRRIHLLLDIMGRKTALLVSHEIVERPL